jgi:hypothetical protein
LEISKHIAKKSLKAGVKYIAIGVGDQVDDEELRIVAASDESRIYKLDSFDELKDIVARVALQSCQGTHNLKLTRILNTYIINTFHPTCFRSRAYNS